MALPIGDQFTDEDLLLGQSLIWNHTFHYTYSFSLSCVVNLGIPDIIHKYGKPMPLPDLVEALAIDKAKANCLHRLMRLLIHSGFFLETPEGYAITPASRLLLKDDSPYSIAPFLLHMLDPILTQPWNHLSSWFKSDKPDSLFEVCHGKTFYNYISNEPKINYCFNEAMASDARLMSSLVPRKCKDVFEGLDSLVDVGGGTGVMAHGIANAFPELRCIVLDLPHVVDGLKGTNNLSFAAGDMIESVPKANAVFLKWILHGWSDEKCVTILKNCRKAILSYKRGKVIIFEIVIGMEKEEKYIQTQLFLDLHMMGVINGKERNQKDWAKLFFDAGFSNYKITHVIGLRSIIEVYP